MSYGIFIWCNIGRLLKVMLEKEIWRRWKMFIIYFEKIEIIYYMILCWLKKSMYKSLDRYRI